MDDTTEVTRVLECTVNRILYSSISWTLCTACTLTLRLPRCTGGCGELARDLTLIPNRIRSPSAFRILNTLNFVFNCLFIYYPWIDQLILINFVFRGFLTLTSFL